VTYDPNSPEARMGALAETQAARLLQRRGAAVLPVFSALRNTEETEAPMLYAPHAGLAVGPDLLCFRAGGNVWIDVKGKAVPTWRRVDRRWEHGIDYANFIDYSHVADFTGLPVWLLLREERTPADPMGESELISSVSWLTIHLVDAARVGEHRPDWPGGAANPRRRGRHGQGGWLWPRAQMRPWVVATESAPAPRVEAA
jgi:hypothetical protein